MPQAVLQNLQSFAILVDGCNGVGEVSQRIRLCVAEQASFLLNNFLSKRENRFRLGPESIHPSDVGPHVCVL